MTHKKNDNENNVGLSDKLEIQNKEIREIKLSIREITRSIENVYQLLLTNRNLCSNCQQQKLLNSSGGNIINTRPDHRIDGQRDSSSNLMNNLNINSNNNNSINSINNNNIQHGTRDSSNNLLNNEQIKFLQRSKTFSQESDILTLTLTDRSHLSSSNSSNNSFSSISLPQKSPRNIPTSSSSQSPNSNNTLSTSASALSPNSNRPKVPILHLKRDISNPNLVKQWINDTVRIKADEKDVDEKIIKLDIGGKYYSTSITTLTKHPSSMLGIMFSGRYELPRDKEGRVFIDRDGKLFGYILSYLRDGPLWSPPNDIDLKRRVEIEMSYYGLPSIEYIQKAAGASPMSTPRCVCEIKNQTLGQGSEHQGIWEEIRGMTSNIKSFRLLVTMNNILFAITERVHDITITTENDIGINNNSNGGGNSATSSGSNSPSIIGSGSNTSITFQFEEYNSRSNSWSYICPVLDTMTPHYFAAGVVGDVIYAFPDAGLHQPIYRFDCKEVKWKNAETKLPSGKTGFSLAVLDDYIYIIGGYKGSTLSDSVERYHPKSNSWCSVGSMLTKRAEGSTVIHENWIYIIGGSIPNTTIERYNPHSNVWSFVCNLSNGQFKVSTAACIDGKIYAIGAENESYSNNIVLQFNPSTNSWKRVAPLLANSYNPHSSVVLDRFIYFIPWSGGSNVHKYESCFC